MDVDQNKFEGPTVITGLVRGKLVGATVTKYFITNFVYFVGSGATNKLPSYNMHG